MEEDVDFFPDLLTDELNNNWFIECFINRMTPPFFMNNLQTCTERIYKRCCMHDWIQAIFQKPTCNDVTYYIKQGLSELSIIEWTPIISILPCLNKLTILSSPDNPKTHSFYLIIKWMKKLREIKLQKLLIISILN